MLYVICFVILVLITVYKVRIRQSTTLPFPPGPKSWPFLGNLHAFGQAPLTSMLQWKKQYGSIVGLQLGEFKAVLISDDKLLKEAFNNPAFNGRPDFRPALLFTDGQSKGTLTSSGEPWDVIRRFTVKHLNELGFGKKSMEGLILENIEEFLQQLKNNEGCSIELHDLFYVPTSANLWYILTGELIPKWKVSRVQESLIKLNNALWQPIGSPIWFYPSLTKWFPTWTGWTTLTKVLPSVKGLVQEKIKQHLQAQASQTSSNDNNNNNNNNNNRNEDLNPSSSSSSSSDLIDAFLNRINSTADPTSSFYNQTGVNHMQSMILNLFVTAAEAMSNTLSWTVLYLSLYPEVQEKLYNEIKTVIGSERSPSLQDQQNMPYAKAVIQELLRISSTSPFSNFQSTTTDVEFHGYFIPKDTVIIANLYGLHHDETIWADPETFRPERFLLTSSSSSAPPPPPPIMPFSVGLRTCIGQTYAKNQLFLFIISMCQKFKFSLDSAQQAQMNPKWLTEASRVSIFRFCPKFKSKWIERRTGTDVVHTKKTIRNGQSA